MEQALKKYDDWQKYLKDQAGDYMLFQNSQDLHSRTINELLSELLDQVKVLECAILELKKEKEENENTVR